MSRNKRMLSRLNPRSENQSIDRMFRHCMNLLRKEVKLYQHRNLRNPDDRRKRLYGFFHYSPETGADKAEIFLDSHNHRSDRKKKESKARSFCHELGHVVSWDIEAEPTTEEDRQRKKEKEEIFAEFFVEAFLSLFTRDQRKLLLSFIPRHYVKRQPLQKKRNSSRAKRTRRPKLAA